MAIEDWSENIKVVELQEDPAFSDDIATLAEQLNGKATHVVLNLSGIRYLNSSNLATLLKLRKQLSNQHKRLILCGIDTKVWGIFMATGVDKLFERQDNVALALAGLQIAEGPEVT